MYLNATTQHGVILACNIVHWMKIKLSKLQCVALRTKMRFSCFLIINLRLLLQTSMEKLSKYVNVYSPQRQINENKNRQTDKLKLQDKKYIQRNSHC